jgi:hypothetical protein
LLIGIAAGAWLGEMVAGIYNRYFKFPELAFAVPLRTALGATALTLVAATGGAYAAVRRAVGIPPAEAMRPEPPARFHKTIFETRLIAAELGAVGRMVVRNISRHPLRAAASIFGIASAVSLLMVGMVLFDAMDHLIDTQFWVMQRQDAAIGFVEPRSSRVRYELAHLPGVLAVEPRRTVAVRVRAVIAIATSRSPESIGVRSCNASLAATGRRTRYQPREWRCRRPSARSCRSTPATNWSSTCWKGSGGRTGCASTRWSMMFSG